MRTLFFVLGCVILAIPCDAATITVDDDWPADFNSIQPAIDSASDGDMIIVQPGLYAESIHFLGKNITLTGTNLAGPNTISETVIDGSVLFNGSEDPNCTLIGFNINGVIAIGPPLDSNGVPDPNYEPQSTHATISHCVLKGNSVYAGTVISFCDGIISDCLVADNIASKGSLVITATILYCHGLIKNCTIVNNYSANGVQVLWYGGHVTVDNCIIYGNLGDQVFVPIDASASIRYTNIQGGLNGILGGGNVNWGPGNIDADPCFIREGYWEFEPRRLFEGDYRLLEDSLCIDAGDPNFMAVPNETDLDGNPRVRGDAVDMGAYEFVPAIVATIVIRPETLNLTSKGKWITCRIWLPEDYNTGEIDSNSIFLEGEVGPESVQVNEQAQVMIAKFKRSEVQEMLEPGEVELIVTGKLADGTVFTGTDTIKVIDKGKKK